jgi:hypothetical protein
MGFARRLLGDEVSGGRAKEQGNRANVPPKAQTPNQPAWRGIGPDQLSRFRRAPASVKGRDCDFVRSLDPPAPISL